MREGRKEEAGGEEKGLAETEISLPIQAKLTIGEPNDKYEQEADRVARQVVDKIHSPTPETVQRQEMGDEDEDEVRLKSEAGSGGKVEAGVGVTGVRNSPIEGVRVNRKVNSEGETQEASMQEKSEAFTEGIGATGGYNPTGLPDNMKTGIESLSGISVDDVKVHYNSNKPAEIQALAYTQGTDIYVSPGQEKHLPHEAWHVVQQMQGRVKPTKQAKGVSINDNADLEHEANVMGAKALQMSAEDAELKSNAPSEIQTLRYIGVVQRVIPGLEEIKKLADIPDEWVKHYINDVLNHESHLYDEDIIAYLGETLSDWHNHALMKNTGGNHWDVELKADKGQTIIVKTKSDGNCGIHAIHAVLSRTKFTENSFEHAAPISMINHVRGKIQERIRQDPNEIKKRIILTVQRSHYLAFTGFRPLLTEALLERANSGVLETDKSEFLSSHDTTEASTPDLKEKLRRYERYKRLLDNKVSPEIVKTLMIQANFSEEEADEFIKSSLKYVSGKSQSEESPKTSGNSVEEIRDKILAIEEQLMDLVDFEANEKQFLEDIKKAIELRYQHQKNELESAQRKLQEAQENKDDIEAAQQQVTRLQKEWTTIKEKVKKVFDSFKQRSKKKIAKNQESITQMQTSKRQEWMRLMAKLCGTHTVNRSGGSESSSGMTKRHDSKPGVYGRQPSEEDKQIGHRHVEVLHGHGGWHRTGLLSHGLLSDDMPGLTSLNEIVERANVIRKSKGLLALPLNKVDLAFVDHHGSTIMMDKVIRGAYPNLMPLPIKLHKEVVELIEEAKTKNQDPDTYIHGKCSRTIPNSTPKQNRRKDREYPDSIQWINKDLWEAYKRVKEGTASGTAAEYVDILEASTHGKVKFPDSRLGHLMGFDQGEKTMKDQEIPHYQVSTVDDLKSTDWNRVSASLSDAIVERLSEIETVDRPIRIVWAGCRSEQWPKDFSDHMFLQWITNAAKARKEAAERTTND